MLPTRPGWKQPAPLPGDPHCIPAPREPVVRNLAAELSSKHLTIGNSLVAQRLRLKLQTFTAVVPGSIPWTQVQSLVRELRSHKPHSVGKTKQETLNDYPKQSSWLVVGTQETQVLLPPLPTPRAQSLVSEDRAYSYPELMITNTREGVTSFTLGLTAPLTGCSAWISCHGS